MLSFFFFSSRRRHTRSYGDWSSDVCSSDLIGETPGHDVVACPPLGVVDADDEVVGLIGPQSARRFEGEGSVATFVIAKVMAIQPYVRQVPHSTELEHGVLVCPAGAEAEVNPV